MMQFRPVIPNPVRAQVNHPRPPHVVGQEIVMVSESSVIKAKDFYEYEEDIFVNGQYLARKGDVWWKVYEVDGQLVSGWTPEKHLGETLLTILPV